MTNYETLSKAIEQLGYEVGTISKLTNELTQANVKKVIEQLNEESTEIYITNKKVEYIITIETVDDEKDITMLSKCDYENKYGNIDNR